MRQKIITWCLATLLIPAGACALGDAEEEGQGQEAGDAALHDLAEVYGMEMEPDEVEAVHGEFAALSSRELDAFNDILEGVTFSRVTAGLVGEAAGEAGQDVLRQQLRAVTSMRKETNRLSMEAYGRPYNQIDGDELDRLLPSLAGDYPALRARGPDGVSIAACDPGSYPLTALASGPTLRFGTGWTRYYENVVAQDREQDCDLIYAYRGTFTRMRAVTTGDAALLTALGGQTRMRHTGFSDIQLGAKVWLFFGHPNLVTLRMY